MRLLEKKQINSQLNEEKRQSIQSGVFIAKKIDALREEMLNLEKERDEFIAGSQDVINSSLSLLHQKEYDLKNNIKDLESRREELLKPLDEKWTEVNQAESKVKEEKEANRLDREQINEDLKKINETKKEISQMLTRAKFKEGEADQARNNALSFEEVAKKESETAKTNRQNFDREYEKKLSELQTKIETYENGITVNERKEKDLEERENQLLKDTKHLESKQRQLRIAYEVNKKNGHSSPADNIN